MLAGNVKLGDSSQAVHGGVGRIDSQSFSTMGAEGNPNAQLTYLEQVVSRLDDNGEHLSNLYDALYDLHAKLCGASPQESEQESPEPAGYLGKINNKVHSQDHTIKECFKIVVALKQEL